jgi:hypothetical protein
VENLAGGKAMNLYHYFEKGKVPFLTLSDLPDDIARKTQDALKRNGNVYTRRDHDGKYIASRRIVEDRVRLAFIDKGGKPVRQVPIYFILGESESRNHIAHKEWHDNQEYIEIPIIDFDMDTVSFTYGDSFVENHPEHRDQSKYHETVYTYREILEKIKEKGWPQDLLSEDSPWFAPVYIEAQVWSDEVISKYKDICRPRAAFWWNAASCFRTTNTTSRC